MTCPYTYSLHSGICLYPPTASYVLSAPFMSLFLFYEKMSSVSLKIPHAFSVLYRKIQSLSSTATGAKNPFPPPKAWGGKEFYMSCGLIYVCPSDRALFITHPNCDIQPERHRPHLTDPEYGLIS